MAPTRHGLCRVGTYFPVTLFRWSARHTYAGDEVNHLWFSDILGPDSYGNLVVIWRGPMDVKLENIRDQAERVGWQKGARISGPDLLHVIAEFPQIGSQLSLMYAFQALLADELASEVSRMGAEATVRGTDIYIKDGKLNVGVCAANPTSCTMHFGVNMGLTGSPPIPERVRAFCLLDLTGGDEAKAVKAMDDVVLRWLSRVDGIYLKAYKTV